MERPSRARLARGRRALACALRGGLPPLRRATRRLRLPRLRWL